MITKQDSKEKYCECCGELISEIKRELDKATPKYEVKVVQVRKKGWHKKYNNEEYFYNTGQSLFCAGCGNRLNIQRKDSFLVLEYKCDSCGHKGGLN